MSGKKKFEPVFMRSANNYDVEEASNAAVVGDHGPSLTVQAMSEDADINVMMERYGITGKMPQNPRLPSYGDFEGINDFQSALNAISDAQEGFMELPAKVRARFNNSAQELLEFCEKVENREEAIQLGLVKRVPGEVHPGAVVPPTAPQAPMAVPGGPAVAVPPPRA